MDSLRFGAAASAVAILALAGVSGPVAAQSTVSGRSDARRCAGRTPDPPVMTNTCYSMVDDRQAIHVASVHRFDAAQKTMIPVAGAGGLSSNDRARWALEGRYAWSWAQTIWAGTLG